MHLPEYVVFDQDPSQRDLLRFDFCLDVVVEKIETKPYDSKLNHLSIGLTDQQNPACIVVFIKPRTQDLHVDKAIVESLHRHGHVFIMIEQRGVSSRELVRTGFLEFPELVTVRIEQVQERLQVRRGGSGSIHEVSIRN